MLPQFPGRKNDFVRSLSRRDAMKMAVCRCILPPPLAHTGSNRFFTSLRECARNHIKYKEREKKSGDTWKLLSHSDKELSSSSGFIRRIPAHLKCKLLY